MFSLGSCAGFVFAARRSEVTNLESGATQVFRFAGTKNK
jgi:hypothetical protein